MRPPPRRGTRGAPPPKPRLRLGTIFFLLGLLTVLGGTFVVGALAGRLSLRPTASLASAPKPGERASKPSAPQQPELTFYRELTAPLTPPPLPPKPPARPAPKPAPPTASRPADAAGEPVKAREPEGAPAPATPPSTPPPVTEGARYTVQVAAYNARPPADSLRARLAAAGHDAYVTEGETAGGTRYRVRIGTFATAEEARQAAGRIGAQAQVPTYVTTR